MSPKFLYQRKAVAFGMLSESRRRKIRKVVARNHLFDAEIQAFFRNLQQLFCFFGNLPDRDGDGGITEIALIVDAEIKSDNIAVLQLQFAGNAVNHLMIDRGAERLGIAAVSFERRLGPVLSRLFFRDSYPIPG